MAKLVVTVPDILVHLRDEIVAARERRDGETLSQLVYVVGTLRTLGEGKSEECYDDLELVTVTDNLGHAISDWFYGAPSKSKVPTGEEIRTYMELRDGSWPRWSL